MPNATTAPPGVAPPRRLRRRVRAPSATTQGRSVHSPVGTALQDHGSRSSSAPPPSRCRETNACHRRQPERAARYPLPDPIEEEGMRRLVFVLVGALTLLLAACSSDDGGATGTTATATAPTGATAPTAATGATGSAECENLSDGGPIFTIRIADFAYDPSCFTASAQQGIKIVNEDDVDHTFTIPDTQIDVPVAAGETFNGEPISGALAPGTYDVVCTIHPEMTGRV